MPTVIIIGFQYDNTNKELKSTITDSYLIYSFYKKLGYRIYIASDASYSKPSDKLTKLLVDDIVDEKYLHFAKSHFMEIKHDIKTKNDLKIFFDMVEITGDRKVFVYYTGHGDKKGIKLPDKTVLSAVDFRKAILEIGRLPEDEATISTNSDYHSDLSLRNGINSLGSQLFIMMDCCNPHGLYLPYKLGSSENRYISQTFLHVPVEIILLTATDSDSSVIADDSVSVFTKNFIDILKKTDTNVDLPHITKNISPNSNPMTYVSYPTTMVLWPWIYTNLIDCEVNELLDALVVVKK
jgi:hypothetical protein